MGFMLAAGSSVCDIHYPFKVADISATLLKYWKDVTLWGVAVIIAR